MRASSQGDRSIASSSGSQITKRLWMGAASKAGMRISAWRWLSTVAPIVTLG